MEASEILHLLLTSCLTVVLLILIKVLTYIRERLVSMENTAEELNSKVLALERGRMSWSLDWVSGELKHIYILCSMSPFALESNFSSLWIAQDMHKKVIYLSDLFKKSELHRVGRLGEAAELSIVSANLSRSNGEQLRLKIEEVAVQKIDLQRGRFQVPPEQFWSSRTKEVS